MERTFIMTSEFDKAWSSLGLTDIDLKNLQNELLNNPDSGDLIKGTHGCRKIRISLDNRGKSGSARVIYVDFIRFEKLYLLTAYAKKDKANLSKQEMNSIKEKVKTIEFLERTSYERRKEYECI